MATIWLSVENSRQEVINLGRLIKNHVRRMQSSCEIVM